jgi:hypothetical protein
VSPSPRRRARPRRRRRSPRSRRSPPTPPPSTARASARCGCRGPSRGRASRSPRRCSRTCAACSSCRSASSRARSGARSRRGSSRRAPRWGSVVAAARAQNDRSGQRVPEGADLWLAHVGPAAPLPDAAPAAALTPDEERAALAASGALHELPLFSTWLAEEPFLREVAAKLDEVTVSPLYVDERQRAEQVLRTVADAVERYFDEGRRALLSQRLLAVSAHLDERGDAAGARAAAAAARALSSGVPARGVPFARLLVEKAFPGVATQDALPEAPAEGSPLVLSPR